MDNPHEGATQSADEIAGLKQAVDLLHQQEQEARLFGEQLIALVEVGNELSKSTSSDDLFRRAVELGRQRLGFDRLSIWLQEEQEDCMRGTFGIDEDGNLRDEREWRTFRWSEPQLSVRTRFRYMARIEAEIVDYHGQSRGKGMRSAAALWDGENIIGFLCTDNLLTGRPITESQNQLLAMYGMTLGHLWALQQSDRKTQSFNERLTRLLEVGNELSRIASFEDLCRRAVDLARARLDFDRVSIWFLDRKSDCLTGSFGTDEKGSIRDERQERFLRPFGADIEKAIEQKVRIVTTPETSVYDLSGHVFMGKAARAVAALWDGEDTIGCVATDTLLTGRPLTAQDHQMLVLYAATLGHLFTRHRVEAERLQIEAQFQQAQKMESLGVLAGGIAHDFNNLLTGILGNADLALMDMQPLAPACDRIKEIVAAAKRAADLTRQMLAYSGKGRFVIRPVVLNEVIEEMAYLLEASISKKAILRFNFSPGLPAVSADADQMRQVIMNMVTNASEAIGDKVGYIAISTGVMDCDLEYLERTWLYDKCPPGRYVYLEVSDTGCGMDKEMLGRIFDPFFSTKFMGRGLGLAAVIGIVRGHNGALKVYSEPGKGTTFKILLPAMDAERAQVQDKPPAPADWRGTGAVLLVDDEEIVRSVGKLMLERQGFAVLLASDGGEAVRIYQEHADDIVLVLLDLTMPRMDGMETFRELRRIRENVRVVLSSGYSETEVVDRFAGKGLAGFIQKPYLSVSLTAKIREAMGT